METSRAASTAAKAKSPKESNSPPSAHQDVSTSANKTDATAKPDGPAAPNDGSKPLGPPPQPGQQGNEDYFSTNQAGSLSLEPNPFEQSFGAPSAETPGGTKLPPVGSITSPSPLIQGSGATPFNWPGGSLRSGPLSPAMLSGPANDYFGETHQIRGGFPTPNESSLRSGLTPGGSGSMFPAPSPNSALLAQLAGGGATPSTLEFHRTALSAAAKREMQTAAHNQQQAPTSQPAVMPNNVTSAPVKSEPKQSGPFDLHDNDAANGLFMLAQGRNGAQNPTGIPVTQPQSSAPPAPTVQVSAPPRSTAANPSAPAAGMNGGASAASGSMQGSSETGSPGSEGQDRRKPAPKGKGKKNSANGTTSNGRRKADDSGTKGPPAKKAKTSSANADYDNSDDEEEDGGDDDSSPKSKMTDDEKRRNFLERNRVAALKCRQRKKQWLASLQSKVEIFSNENEALSSQISQLREEVVNLKTLLLAHKDCPVTQHQTAMQGPYMQVVEPYNGQMNPYGMAAPPLPNQPVMTGQPIQRRFS
ncbi:related to transcription factor atf1+ [Cephalotrichum gorgonifer]|uniref:Related to transcription factor atf1 n=1 Tax=Cephalotrichum gorgonifer TaxID=2041049 RepID=A0AAE8MRV0_9PEZI|nr:related to transcription factor atf1+ [Cephalotrichum gorgonifer]